MNLKNTIHTLYNQYRHFILYGIIGGMSAGLDFLIYTFLCKLGLNYQIANVISIHCGIFCSFLFNRRYNFKITDKTLLRFFSFYIVGLTGLALSAILLYAMIDIIAWNEIYAKLLSIIVIAVVQFFLNKFITFKKSKTL